MIHVLGAKHAGQIFSQKQHVSNGETEITFSINSSLYSDIIYDIITGLISGGIPSLSMILKVEFLLLLVTNPTVSLVHLKC